jgi:hypothetical protein
LVKVTAEGGGVDKPAGAVIQATEKLPADNPELIVALVPGQTPFAEVVTVADGSG